MKKLFIPFILIMISSSCNQDEEIRPRLEWPFEFVAVNNGDSVITRMNLHTHTYYPEEKRTSIIGRGNNIWSDNAQFLTAYDSISIRLDKLVYAGCIVYFEVWVAKLREPDGHKPSPEIFRKYFLQDTLRDATDSSLIIVWPRDSAMFTKR